MIVNSIFLLLLSVYVVSVVKMSYKSVALKPYKNFLLLMVIEHFLLTVCAFLLTEPIETNDAYRFYTTALNGDSWVGFLKPGSPFFVFLIYPFVKAGMSLFSCFFLFSTLSLLAFLKYFKEYSQNDKNCIKFFTIPIALWILLLPSFHFWSGLFGKDALFFFLITFLLFEVKNNRLFTFYNMLSFLLMLLLRPHFFIVVLCIFLIGVLFQKTISVKIKWYFTFFSILLVFVSFPIIKFFLHFPDFSSQTINKLIEGMNFLANTSGSGISIQETNYGERIWMLLFRPLFFDANNNFQLWISIENVIMLFFFAFMLFVLFKNKNKKDAENFRHIFFSIGVSLGFILMISSYIYNLGLASRMRLMFFPLLIYGLQAIIKIQNNEK